MNDLKLVVCSVLLLIAGCNSIGPTTIARDRFDYSGALAESWKNQMLLNLVKMRYLDLPIYLDVGQIVAGYSVETSATAAGEIGNTEAGTNFLGLGATRKFTDRPTITYTPLTGERFLEGFLKPIDMTKVMALVQSGISADFILELSLESLNGLRNRPVSLGSTYAADADFFRALRLLREIQDAGALGLRVEHAKDDRSRIILFFRSDRIHPDVPAKIRELRGVLGLAPERADFRLVSSPLPAGPGELAIATRSLMQVMTALALGVEVPAAHVQRRLTPALPGLSAGESGPLRVHSGSSRPEDAFVSVTYEGAWFWIANDDWRSKRSFSSMLFIFTLADVAGRDRAPVLTIPAQ